VNSDTPDTPYVFQPGELATLAVSSDVLHISPGEGRAIPAGTLVEILGPDTDEEYPDSYIFRFVETPELAPSFAWWADHGIVNEFFSLFPNTLLPYAARPLTERLRACL
jgi:hypothetical protein